jgi:hypothetical protein
MSGTGASVDWRQLREFSGVDIERSFILSWQLERDVLPIDVDLMLTEKHPFYEKPRPKEKACIRAAILEFPCCESITLQDEEAAKSLADLTGRLRGGEIRSLCRVDDGPYVISGDFGTVTIDAERPILRLHHT